MAHFSEIKTDYIAIDLVLKDAFLFHVNLHTYYIHVLYKYTFRCKIFFLCYGIDFMSVFGYISGEKIQIDRLLGRYKN